MMGGWLLRLLVCLAALAALLWALGESTTARGEAHASQAPAMETIALAPDWNLVSLPLIPADPSPAALLAPIKGKYEGVFAWQPEAGWLFYFPEVGGTLAGLDEKMGFWIKMKEEASLRVSGQRPTTTRLDLAAGWNLIGWPGPAALVETALAPVAAKVGAVFAWGSWLYYFPDIGGPLIGLEPRRGYWLEMKEAASLTVVGAPPPHPGAILPELAKVADLPGGDVLGLAFAPSLPNVIYLASNANAMGIWRSDDAGENWQQILTVPTDHTYSLAVHPHNPDTFLMGTNHGIIRGIVVRGLERWGSAVQWEEVYETAPLGEPIVPVFALAFSPSRPSVTYAADAARSILRSSDGGATWQAVAQLEERVKTVFSVAVDPRSPFTLYAGTGMGVFKSADGGGNWRQVLAHGPVFHIASGVSDTVFAAGAGGVFKSTNGGASWRWTFHRRAHSVQVSTSEPRVVYAGTPQGVFRSSDGGETWALRSMGMEYRNVGPLTVHPRDANTVIAASNVELWTRYLAPFPVSTRGDGIYKTVNGGLFWVRAGRQFVDVDVFEVAVDPKNANIVYAGPRCSRGLYRSDDGGASWEVRFTGPHQTAHYTMRVAVTVEGSVWLTGGDGVGWSSDGGRTWHPVLAEKERHFHGLAISPHDPKLIFVGTVGHDPPGTTFYPGAIILRSSNGGAKWQEMDGGFPKGINTAIEDFAFDPFNPKILYVASSSFHPQMPPGPPGFEVISAASTTLGIYKSTDGGNTWRPANTGLSNMDVYSIGASPLTRGVLYAGTAAGVFRSRDGGGSWSPTGLRERVHRLLIDPSKPRSLYAGSDNGLFWSPDEGATWHRLDSVPAKPVTGLAMDALGKVLYAAVNGVGVFKGVKGSLPGPGPPP